LVGSVLFSGMARLKLGYLRKRRAEIWLYQIDGINGAVGRLPLRKGLFEDERFVVTLEAQANWKVFAR